MNSLLNNTVGKARNYVDLKKDARRGDIEMGEAPMGDGGGEVDMTQFFDEVGVIKSEMDRIKQLLEKVQAANDESRTVHKAQAMKALRSRMDSDIAQVTKLAKSIKLKLEVLDRANAANRRVRGCEEGSPTDRTRTSITSTLRKKLKDLMGEFQVLRQRMMEEYKETVERRYYTVTGEHADDDTIENIIETGNSETFLQKAIQEQGRGQVLDTIKEIQERHDAVKEIERNLIELNQIFMDMATLVEAQGEQLNDIEQHVNKATSFVERGTTQLKVAKDHQRAKRKWVCMGIALIIILILIVLLPILRSVGAI
ncbi:hypothetical protein M758_6G145200 [Ceratodon purpureus]|uniref:t-SNARE coiled-coil homology domain-containing protein n=1 Tax=Ceratodon purpureus TaxID=3225 RepID=A0A8T0HGU5_CERPU|nr:hypothetical protein KC19_6G151000 [Ceratodon purpureus]KAG0614019.1 hypothetical protein M758_6G145200 [Ceratodon purpureus]